MGKRSVQAYIEEVPSWEGGTRLAGPPLSAMQWLVWSLATAGKFFEGLIVFMGGIALPLIAEQFGMTTTDKGLVTAATLAGILIGALALGGLADRLGGHLVSGHVDGAGTVRSIEPQSGSWRLEIGWNDPAYGRYVCEKASIAVDGISLTVAGCRPDGACFWIAVIPHTWTRTTLAGLRAGDRVNLEADLLAKYTERLLAPGGGGPIDAAWLAEHGWQA